MAVICRKQASQCVWQPEDDDVLGHSVESMQSATITIRWSEESDGTRHVEFRSDDPEAEQVLMGLLDRAARATVDAEATPV